MAICLRRILRSHNLFTYSTLRTQQALLDQKNASSSSATAIEANEGYLVSTIPNKNIVYPSKLDTSSSNVPDKIMCEDTWKNELTFVGNDLYCDKFFLSSMFEKDVHYCVKECKAYKKKETQKENSGPHLDRPDTFQLQSIQKKLCEDLPRIFEKPLDYEIYHENMIFENNIRGTKTVGIKNYMKQIAFLRLYASVLFSSVKFDILRSTTHEEDGTVRVRWRIRGVPGFKVIILFWKQKVWRQKEDIQPEEGWFDGFSIFYVKSDGLVHKHVATKLMPDDGGGITIVQNPLAAKLALITGFASHDLVSESVLEGDGKNHLMNYLYYSNFNASKWNYSSFIPFICVFDKKCIAFMNKQIEN